MKAPTGTLGQVVDSLDFDGLEAGESPMHGRVPV
jgi:hypothetical protein